MRGGVSKSLKTLRILPKDQAGREARQPEKSVFEFNIDKNMYFTDSGKGAIRAIAEVHSLKREDEVCIVSTSNSPFVSSCVTCTLFNYCKVSRVLTDKTRLIFVIHEFGFPCEQLESMLEEARHRGIPLVEDVAHSFTSSDQGKPLGSDGDYVIYSLPKSLPVESGGIVLSSTEFISTIVCHDASAASSFSVGRDSLQWVHAQRRKMYEALSAEVSKQEIFRFTDGVNPFCFAYEDDPNRVSELYDKAERLQIEMLRTHNSGWVTIPLNPWIMDQDLDRLIQLVRGD
jgi:hypothetical protein